MINFKKIFCAAVVLVAFSQNSFGDHDRDRGGGRIDRQGGGWSRWDQRDRFDRNRGGQFEHNMTGAFLIGRTLIANGRDFDVINTNVIATQVNLCVDGEDIFLKRLAVEFGNGTREQLDGNDIVRAGSCTGWRDLPGEQRRIVSILVVGSSGRDFRGNQARVKIFGKQIERPRPSRTWVVNSTPTFCGDGGGPYHRDGQNNRIQIPACPNMSPGGGPIGMACGNLPRGSLCYGSNYWSQGFFCSAPNGSVPPWGGANIFNIYVCP